jgi:two-component system, OmpR family, sensor kinase
MRSTLGGITAQVRLLVFGMVALVAVAGLAGLAGVAIVTSAVTRLTDELVPASDANESVLQDMTDAETGIRGWVATQDRTFLEPFHSARRALVLDRARLRQFARDHTSFADEVAAQERAVDDWITSYAEPRLREPAGPANISHQRLLVGKQKFDRVRRSNAVIQNHLTAKLNEARLSAFQELPWVVFGLLFVALLGGIASVFARRAAAQVTQPLVDMQRTVDRLRAGDTAARAHVAGPREVRRVGEALNSFAEQNERLLELERQAVERLEQLDRAKSDFVSNISHELRTPLTSIAGYVELFEDGFIDRLTPQQRGMLTVVNRNVSRLQSLIEDLLTLSQVESQAFRTTFDLLDLNHLVSDVGHDLDAEARRRGIGIHLVQPPRPMVMRGDASQLSRALLNLTSNAVKFSSDGGQVTLRVRQSGREAVIEVSDHGIGIPSADLEKVAGRFFRASNAVDAEITGTGLGLRIVQTILDNHGGRLEIESVEGEGTTARMLLPLAEDALPDALRRATAPSGEENAPTPR